MAKKTVVVACGMLLLTVLSIGCRYLEQETPAGTVPPAPRAEAAQPAEELTVSQEGAAAKKPGEAEPSQRTIEEFREAYIRNGAPRIVVFVNRELSDDAREWSDDARALVVEQTDGERASGDGDVEETERRVSTAAYAGSQLTSNPRVLGVSEDWMWALEDGLLEPFLQAGAVVVDRATVLRVTAAEAGNDDTIQPISMKRVEIEALQDHADLLAEVLVARSFRAPDGCTFKASVKEIDTGRIIASLTSSHPKNSSRKQHTVVATSEGYKLVPQHVMPTPREAAFSLSVEIMNALIGYWKKTGGVSSI